MTVTPKVYQFAPGAKTGAAIIDGVKRCLDAAGTHHWEVVTYTAGSTITLQDKATFTRSLRLVAITPQNVQAFYTPPGGSESGAVLMAGGLSSGVNTLDNAQYGMSTNIAYVLEVEDAIFILTNKGLDGGALMAPSAMSWSLSAGRIYSAHNRSDATFEEGVMGGGCFTAQSNTMGWLSQDTTSSGTQQSIAWTGGSSFIRICCPTAMNRHSRTASNTALLADIGDAASLIERLVPIPVSGPVSGTTGGHFGYTRYWRARKTPWDGALVTNTTILPSAGDPNIAWRHQFYQNVTDIVINNILIWCPSGQEVIVP